MTIVIPTNLTDSSEPLTKIQAERALRLMEAERELRQCRCNMPADLHIVGEPHATECSLGKKVKP